MGHYRAEMMEYFGGLTEQERLSLEVKLYFEEQKRRDLINRNGVRISRGSKGGIIFTPITDSEAKKKRKH
jgi:hypothetical protein